MPAKERKASSWAGRKAPAQLRRNILFTARKDSSANCWPRVSPSGRSPAFAMLTETRWRVFSSAIKLSNPHTHHGIFKRKTTSSFFRPETVDEYFPDRRRKCPHALFYFLIALRPLATTINDKPTSARTAIHMAEFPASARAHTETFTPRIKTTFCTRIL